MTGYTKKDRSVYFAPLVGGWNVTTILNELIVN